MAGAIRDGKVRSKTRPILHGSLMSVIGLMCQARALPSLASMLLHSSEAIGVPSCYVYAGDSVPAIHPTTDRGRSARCLIHYRWLDRGLSSRLSCWEREALSLISIIEPLDCIPRNLVRGRSNTKHRREATRSRWQLQSIRPFLLILRIENSLRSFQVFKISTSR